MKPIWKRVVVPVALCAFVSIPAAMAQGTAGGNGGGGNGGNGGNGAGGNGAGGNANPPCVVNATVQNLSIERALTLSNLSSTITPNASPAVLAGIASGAQEIRTRLILNAAQNTLTETTFLVAPGSPLPTPLSVDLTQGTLQGYIMSVDRIYTSCQPTPSILVVGTLTSSGAGPFGNFQGAPAAVSIGYTTDNPAKFSNVVEVVAGQVVGYSASAQGTLALNTPAVPGGGGTGPGTGPVITPGPGLSVSQSVQVFQNPLQLSATAVDPNNLALTYQWSADKPVDFVPSANVQNPVIQFGSGRQDYKITLTVTNSAGVPTSQTYLLSYQGR